MEFVLACHFSGWTATLGQRVAED